MFLLTWLLGVSRGDTWLFLPNLVEVRDVGACVVRLWSHLVAPVFHEFFCLDGYVPRVASTLCLTPLFFGSVGGGTTFGVPGGGPGGFDCELQENVAVVVGCACYERGCWFARAAVGFVVGLHIRVGVSQRLREPTCGVAFTGAGLWPVDLVKGVCLVGCPLVVGVHAEGCFRIVFDSAGSTGVVSCPTLVEGHGITLLRCFVVLCSRCFSLYCFLE
ncbi:hypothetical protein Taro_040033 [Colocasia esculenta]|uniref:Uncharacterized protein n=1 Tax=Colocasia esculenta TaxID=4460 RepID=A0A843WRV2_COLES|nr:hypothetical protein [Colocasia esculenta]